MTAVYPEGKKINENYKRATVLLIPSRKGVKEKKTTKKAVISDCS